MKHWLIALAALAAAQTAGAATTPQPIETAADKPWTHKASGLELPASISGFVRNDLDDLSGGAQNELASAYRDPDSGTLATVFVFRPAMPSAPLWFDIANWFLRRNRHFAPEPGSGPIGFTVGDRSVLTALRQVYATGANARSTGVAIVPVGRWLVKVRMTSHTLDGKALDKALESFAKALGWPAGTAPAASSEPIGVCTGKLSEVRARQVREDSASILVGATLASLEEDRLGKGEPTGWPVPCRDDSRTDNIYPIYQLDGGAAGYLIAVSDNGTLLAVRDDRISGSLLNKQNSRPIYRVTLMTPEQWEQYAVFDRLPPVEQAFETVKSGSPLSSTRTVGDRTITIDSDRFR